ncbi:MAG: hypothetical protein AAF226_14880 [Verrucomicrobiota bacterium]
MIALPHELPLIRVGDSSVAVCQPEWLAQTLTDATTGTKIPDWLATDISKGVERFLARHYMGTTIDNDELFDRIGVTLNNMGLSDVAENLDKTPPPVRVSLTDLVRRAQHGYELAFFSLLNQQLHSSLNGGAIFIEFYGIRRAVKNLTGSKKWNSRCDELRAEIVRRIEEFQIFAEITNPIFHAKVVDAGV